jgi:predicted O-methyltransferase YrrM
MNLTPVVQGKFRAARLRAMKMLYGLPAVDLPPPVASFEVASPIMEKICMPPFYYDTAHDDFFPLMKLAGALDPAVIVELGTAHGNTSANLALNCPRARIVTVNAPLELMTGSSTTYSLKREEIGEVFVAAGFAGRITQVFANTLDLDLAPSLAEGEKVDLGIVDACHDEEYVVNDFLKLLPFMSERGVILLHDTDAKMEGHLRGSYMACMKLRKRGHDIRQLRGTWWGVWRRDWSRGLC